MERVLKTITLYSMFRAGDRVGVAVSGGADSVFLLHALHALRPHWDLQLKVLHLDHGLRGEESRADACFVLALAARLGLPAHAGACDVARLAETGGGNLEQSGRQARRQYYMDFLRQGALDRVATGHTCSDQAETVLFRFLRGSGTAGLAGIRPVTSDGLVRPLIDTDRAGIRRYLRDAGIAWREDSSNASRVFARNRIRGELLPQLAREWNPALGENLAQTARWAQDEETYWKVEIDRLAREHLTTRSSEVLFRSADVSGLPRAAARRLVRRAIEVGKGDLLGICFEHVERILDLAEGREGDGCLQVPGLEIRRSFEWIRIGPLVRENQGYRLQVESPGSFRTPDGSVVRMELIESAGGWNCVYNDNDMAVLSWERGRGVLELRNWRPGDRYQPVGRANEEKLKVLFQEARIPLWERGKWPILTIEGEIVWARRFGPALRYAATPASRSVLRVWEERA